MSPDSLVVPCHCSVWFARRRTLTIRDGNLPIVLTIAYVQDVQIVKIFGNVMLRIVGFVGEARKEKHFVADESEAVTQTWTRCVARERRLRTKLFPFPFRGLKTQITYCNCTRSEIWVLPEARTAHSSISRILPCHQRWEFSCRRPQSHKQHIRAGHRLLLLAHTTDLWL